MIYFTADTHFGSERVRFYSRRPFRSVKQTDNALIKNWNKTAKNSDFVYHLGDFGNYELIKRLKGKVILIMGNYEEDDRKKLNMTFYEFKSYLIGLGFADVISTKGIKIKLEEFGEEKINLTHKPLDCDANCFNLFGHVHGLSKVKEFGLNVGVDCFNYKLVDVETIKIFKNAIENVYDNNVFCTKADLINKPNN